MRLNLRLYGPVGGSLTGLDVDGERVSITQGVHLGRQVSILPIELSPGRTAEVAATFETSAAQRHDPVLDWTPEILWGASSTTAPSSC